MATNYPTSLDTSSTTLRTDIASTDDLDASGKEHDTQHVNVSGAAIALETKLGTGSSTPVDKAVLMGDGAGSSAWDTTPTIGGNTTIEGSLSMGDNEVIRPKIKDYGETVSAHGNTSTAETVDLENGNVHTATLDANCAFTFSNPPASGTAGSFTLILTQDTTGSRTVTWPASVDWAGGTAPTLSTGANDVDVLTFLTTDGGTTWLGFSAGLDMS